MRNQEGETESHKKVHIRTCERDITFFWRPIFFLTHFLCHFLLLSSYHKLINSLLVTAKAHFTAKTTNLGKAIYFLSLMPCSINKLLSLTYYSHVEILFSDFMWKKMFALGNGEGLAPPASLLLYGPVLTTC